MGCRDDHCRHRACPDTPAQRRTAEHLLPSSRSLWWGLFPRVRILHVWSVGRGLVLVTASLQDLGVES